MSYNEIIISYLICEIILMIVGTNISSINGSTDYFRSPIRILSLLDETENKLLKSEARK